MLVDLFLNDPVARTGFLADQNVKSGSDGACRRLRQMKSGAGGHRSEWNERLPDAK